MSTRKLAEFLQDILDAITDIETFTEGVDVETFSANREKMLAVIKSIEIIGEAVKQIPENIRNQYAQIPWKSVAGMRDILVHEYWGIDVNVVWETVQENLPSLKAEIIKIKTQLRDED